MMRRKISLEQNRSFYRRNDSLALFPVFLSHLVSEQRSTISRRSHGYLDGENYACRRVIDRIIAATWLKNFIDRVNCNRLRDLAQRSCFFRRCYNNRVGIHLSLDDEANALHSNDIVRQR